MPVRSREWLPADAEPAPCDWHHQGEEGLETVYPPEFRAWSHFRAEPVATMTAQRVGGQAAAPSSERHAPSTQHPAPSALTIANPAEGTVYSIDPTLRREFQALPLRVVAAHPTSVIWLMDGAEVGTSSSEKPFDWPLAAGTHEIEARDADGRRARTSVVVK